MSKNFLRLTQLLTAMMKRRWGFSSSLVAGVLASSFLSIHAWNPSVQAQTMMPCQLSAEARQEKENLRQAALQGNEEAQKRYKVLLSRQAEQLKECRRQNWPRNQAVWLRLYPCDIRAGSLDYLMDSIVNKGYNQVYVEVFYDGQVLLPVTDNPTPWQSVLQMPGAERTDLLEQAIKKGQERGLKVYAWLFTINFGYAYAQRPDRQAVLARNGLGKDNISALYETSVDIDLAKGDAGKAFIDPYNPQARQDYEQLVKAVVKRKPDGVLFDYVRYPRSVGAASVAGKVQDLWIYSEATRQVLYQRALNYKGLELIRRFLEQGYITVSDISQVDRMYPDEGEPLWQGRNPDLAKNSPLGQARQPQLQWDLWQLSVAHAAQGILDFLAAAIQPVQQQGIPSGAVFFPGGNKAVGTGGYDSRIQPWDRFPASMEWHPMLYANCGDTRCIFEELERVLSLAPSATKIAPALAGDWRRSMSDRPPLEVQMQALRRMAPQIDTVSHFAYSWQEPENDRERKFCRLQ